jgi:hypothetical protein
MQTIRILEYRIQCILVQNPGVNMQTIRILEYRIQCIFIQNPGVNMQTICILEYRIQCIFIQNPGVIRESGHSRGEATGMFFVLFFVLFAAAKRLECFLLRQECFFVATGLFFSFFFSFSIPRGGLHNEELNSHSDFY